MEEETERQVPRALAVSKTAKVCPVSGTGVKGKGIATCAIKEMNAVPVSTAAKFFAQVSESVSTKTLGLAAMIDISLAFNFRARIVPKQRLLIRQKRLLKGQLGSDVCRNLLAR